EQFSYEAVGNLLELFHTAEGNQWRRVHEYGSIAQNNRLTGSRVGSIHERFTYDIHGNTLSMPQLPEMVWNFQDRLRLTRRQVRGEAATYFVYDGAGERVRKVTVSENGTPLRERVYVGLYEVEREIHGGDVVERESIHIT